MITKTTWTDEVINALQALGGEAYLNEIYMYIKNNASRELTDSYQATIRATLERNSSDSDAFSYGNDIFYMVNGKGQGRWGLRK